MPNKPNIVILGGGPAGLGAAYKLAARGRFQVTVVERNPVVGGNAGSFEVAGVRVDFGSHRLHPACPPEVLQDIRELLGEDLLTRPRHGRIRLRGRWIHFPLKPFDLMTRLPASFSLGVAGDVLGNVLSSSNGALSEETFGSVLEAGLGKTICRDFYFPYARKIWGLSPHELSAVQARRRVSAGSLSKMLEKVFRRGSNGRKGVFYYPRGGYGQISEAYAEAARKNKATILLNSRVVAIEAGGSAPHRLTLESCEGRHSLEADHIWSTIPITALAQLASPAAPWQPLQAARDIEYRSMILIYLVLDLDRFTEFDAHYFPEPYIPITRLSEVKNYADLQKPLGRTVICAELPCSSDDLVWQHSDAKLKELVCDSLRDAGIPVWADIEEVVTRRIGFAYPIYRKGFQQPFQQLDDWVDNIPNLLTFGRQGLFAHDNTHHALHMAYSAVRCLGDDGSFNRELWKEFRKEFEEHVVED